MRTVTSTRCPTSTRWFWLRHAPTGQGGRIVGCLDVDAETKDPRPFAALALRLPPEALWLESGLRRCRQTREALVAQGASLAAPPLMVPHLREQDFGTWQGRNWSDLSPEDCTAFWADPATATPPGGESFAAQMARVAAAIRDLNQEHEGRDIVAIAHAGTIRAAVALALDLTPAQALRLALAPLSLTRLTSFRREEGEGWDWAVEEVGSSV